MVPHPETCSLTSRASFEIEEDGRPPGSRAPRAREGSRITKPSGTQNPAARAGSLRDHATQRALRYASSATST